MFSLYSLENSCMYIYTFWRLRPQTSTVGDFGPPDPLCPPYLQTLATLLTCNVGNYNVTILPSLKTQTWLMLTLSNAIAIITSVSNADGEVYTSTESGVYGSDVHVRSYWGGAGYSAWIDYSNALPAGLLQRFYVFAQPVANTDSIGTAISRIQIWRQIHSRSLRRAFQLVWQRRIVVLPCNRTHGALSTVRRRRRWLV